MRQACRRSSSADGEVLPLDVAGELAAVALAGRRNGHVAEVKAESQRLRDGLDDR